MGSERYRGIQSSTPGLLVWHFTRKQSPPSASERLLRSRQRRWEHHGGPPEGRWLKGLQRSCCRVSAALHRTLHEPLPSLWYRCIFCASLSTRVWNADGLLGETPHGKSRTRTLRCVRTDAPAKQRWSQRHTVESCSGVFTRLSWRVPKARTDLSGHAVSLSLCFFPFFLSIDSVWWDRAWN